MESKTKILKAAICITLVCLIWGVYFFVKTYHADRILDIKEDNFSWIYQVDFIKTEGKKLVLQGFAFEIDKNAEEGSFEIVLEDIESGKRYFPKMQYEERADVNEYFLCEYDYLQSGFEAKIDASKLNLDEKEYEILLRVVGERKTYRTGSYLSEGQLTYANSKEFVALESIGEELREIVENGILRVYQPNSGVYVYQYNGALYWIMTSQYNFVNDDSFIEYQVSTTQVDKLPEERLNNQWDWDNIGFSFSNNELKEWATEEYRVAKKNLPREYSIEKIWTGNYVNDWLWIQYFRPYYEFD